MMFQLGSALLDACVLAVLSREDTYGYVLTQSVRNIVEISESTLYPVLRRLQQDPADLRGLSEDLPAVWDRRRSARAAAGRGRP